MKRYTDKKAAKAINNILSVIRYEGNRRKAFYNPWTKGNNTFFCNEFSMYQINGKIPENVRLVPDIEEQNKRAFESARENIINKIFYPTIRNDNLTIIDNPEIEYIRENRNGNKVQLKGENTPYYNPKYLIDMVTLFPDGKYYIDRNKGKLSPLVVVHKNGSGFLLPIRVY